MGQPTSPQPAKLLCGMLAQREEWFASAEEKLAAAFGPIDLASDLIPFDFTDYYTPAMGTGLLRKFVTFDALVAPDRLAATKLATNAIEEELAVRLGAAVPRPVNLDPGLLDGSRLILATTKDNAHRIYLRDGIYAEITLTYRKGAWTPAPWTYRDYQSKAYHQFLTTARALYRAQARKIGPIGPIRQIGQG
ncbi:MAG: DUF4416 family protein [Candidatus Brocadiae bacterium]|nr:DUF4416 family protein [Candidatus Brocadiia bacterium]